MRHEIAGHEIDGPIFAVLQGMKLQDVKMKDQYAGHENAGHEIAGQNSVRPALHYYEVCISCLLLLFS